jgi:DNA-binding SARP family transcriptional activator
VEVAVLGTVEVRIEGAPVDLGSPKQRALIAALALSPGRPVAVDTIVDLLWGERPPASVTSTLQGYVSHLRRVLEPGRSRRGTSTVLVTVAPGYSLAVPAERVDAHAFEAAVARCRASMREFRGWGAPPVSGPELERIVGDLDDALARWRGLPYVELGDAPAVVPERTRLEELRLVAVEDRITAELALGRHTSAAVDLEMLTTQHPLRERLWALRAVALQRSGRQADALATLRELRDVLDHELALDPSPAVRDLETAVLRQDPDLAWTPPSTEAPDTASRPDPVPFAQPSVSPVAPWPLVGREPELAALGDALRRAEGGSPTFAVLTGEPGIGKSRLSSELASRAESIGARVLVGRCSQDDGAPPLWPWRAVLAGLGIELPPPGPTDDVGASFRTWERIVADLERAAQDRLTVVVLDDLHWADASTLRVLGLLTEMVSATRLLVVATWRDREVGPALSDVAEALARRHAVRLELARLSAEAARDVFTGVSHNKVTADQGEALHERTGGNPFFLVEYARLAGARSDVGALLAEREPPATVTDVVRRRLGRLDDKTVEVLRIAAVLGRRFDTDTVAAVVGTDPDLLLDLVEPAQATGLVVEEAIDRYVFVHALVRDTLLIGTSASRRARTHARAAEVLETTTGRESELARHWLAAGPAHAARAWRAAAAAAEQARGLHAHEESADLLVAALDALGDDPDATAADRYDLLLRLIEAYRWSARLPELVGAVERAIDAAEELGDLERAARAALSATQGGLWQSAPEGVVNERVVGTLRASLEALPPGDGDLRCRVLLAIANEESTVVPMADGRAKIDEALAMAARIGEPHLELHARQVACATIWAPSVAEERLAWSTEAVTLARTLEDDQAFVVSSTLRTVVLSELGRADEMAAGAAVTRAEAERLRIPYGELVLGAVTMPWLVLDGRFEEGAELLERMHLLAGRVTESFAGESVVAAQATLWMWQGEALHAAELLHELEQEPYPLTPLVVALMWRAGEGDRARQHLERVGRAALDPGPVEGPLSAYLDSHAAEVALRLGDADLARRCYERLAPYAGRVSQAGSALNAGPVDTFLALAAAAMGEGDTAAAHAEAALALTDRWRLSLARKWIEGLREEFDL